MPIQGKRSGSLFPELRSGAQCLRLLFTGGLSEQAVPAELDGHQETPSELHTLAVQDLEHPLQSIQLDAKQKSFRDIYVQSFTSAFSTGLYSLQQVRHGHVTTIYLLYICIARRQKRRPSSIY